MYLLGAIYVCVLIIMSLILNSCQVKNVHDCVLIKGEGTNVNDMHFY